MSSKVVGSRRARSSRRVLLAALVTLLSGTACQAGAASQEGAALEAPSGPVAFSGREREHFEALEPMVAKADIVIRGTVSERAPGRAVLLDGGSGQQVEAPIGFVNLTVTVDRVLKGDVNEALLVAEALTLRVDPPAGTVAPGYPFSGDSRFLERGSSVILFLKRNIDAGTVPPYSILNSQGAYLIGPGDRLTPAVGDALSGQLARMGRPALEDAIRLEAGR